jgi:hypothetical protein
MGEDEPVTSPAQEPTGKGKKRKSESAEELKPDALQQSVDAEKVEEVIPPPVGVQQEQVTQPEPKREPEKPIVVAATVLPVHSPEGKGSAGIMRFSRSRR